MKNVLRGNSKGILLDDTWNILRILTNLCHYVFLVLMLKMGQQEAGNILMDQAQGLSYNHKTCLNGESPFSTKMIRTSICPQNPLLGILLLQVKRGKSHNSVEI